MGYLVDDLSPTGNWEFERASSYLLPNEVVLFVCQILNGFLVLTSRRVVFIKLDRKQYQIERAIPLDCVLECSIQREDKARVSAITLDKFGCHEFNDDQQLKSIELEIRAPRPDRGEDKKEVIDRFYSTIRQLPNVLDQTNKKTTKHPSPLDYSYLENMPRCLTYDTILDLNTVLQDMPIHDELYHEAVKFLGVQAFLATESLKDGTQRENGVLFAAGNQGYIWIRGVKKGRFMTNVLVDKVEWEHIRCFAHRWQSNDSKILATYSLQKDTTELSASYVWSPLPGQDIFQWVWQELNGPWILADLMYKYSERPMPASWISKKHLKHQEFHKQRYYH